LEVPVIGGIAQNGVERLVGEGKFRGIADNVGEDTGVDVCADVADRAVPTAQVQGSRN
jgi:hypothetical protein